MKYFLDTEFIESFYQPKILGIPFGKKRHFIDLISIGIVAEDGREYYAISNEFNSNDADQWVKDNVLYPLIYDSGIRAIKNGNKEMYDILIIKDSNVESVKQLQKIIGKSNFQISEEIISFIYPNASYDDGLNISDPKEESPEFYAYYGDYDWVLFCSLFGRMIDLPKGFPKYCKDLQQTFDEKKISIKGRMKDQPGFPINEGLHNALDDAKWNFKLFKFLQTL